MKNHPLNYFSHPASIVEEGAVIGKATRVWAFVHILHGAKIGEECNICDHVFIEGDVVVGNRVTIKSGVQLWNGIIIEDNVFIGPNATFTNDPFPRSKQYPTEFSKTYIGKGASIGANATILPGIRIGQKAMIGAGSVVTRDVPQNAIVVGNPARIKGYVSSYSQTPINKREHRLDADITSTKVPGVKIIRLPNISDIRGELTFGEYDKHLPFIPKRYFIIYGVPTKEVRGEHMHKSLQEFLACIQGSVTVFLDNGTEQDEIELSQPNYGLYIPPLIWTVQYKYTSDAILLALASEKYDAADYIRNYTEFLEYIKNNEEY